MEYTILANVDLSMVKGLSKIDHWGPSEISVSTLSKSGGNIPEVFLHGCGVSETFITYARSLVENPFEFFSCFISYSHKDQSFVRRLHDQLQARGIRCWLDEHELIPGEPMLHGVERGLRLTDKVLLCCSEAALSSWWVDHEIDSVLTLERDDHMRDGRKEWRLVPLDLDGHIFSDACQGDVLKVRNRVMANFTDWERDNAKFEGAFEKVVKALRMGHGHKD